jgi:hypothetical protein
LCRCPSSSRLSKCASSDLNSTERPWLASPEPREKTVCGGGRGRRARRDRGGDKARVRGTQRARGGATATAERSVDGRDKERVRGTWRGDRDGGTELRRPRQGARAGHAAGACAGSGGAAGRAGLRRRVRGSGGAAGYATGACAGSGEPLASST